MTATVGSTDIVKKRSDFVLVFDVTNGNPNGDPDAGNAPRVDPETGHGLVSDVCLKRKIRNYITLAKRNHDTGEPEDGFDIYVKEKAILNAQHQRAYEALGLKSDVKGKGKAAQSLKARAWMCQTFFDIRMFGAVMTTEINCGQVRGPVQLTFSKSVNPIVALEQSVTRMAVTTERESEKQDGDNRTMGRKQIVPYGLYIGHGFVSPHLAADTKFSAADQELLWEALKMMFEIDRSAARGEMAMRKLIVFEHESALGNAPAHTLFDRVKATLRSPDQPARRFEDYEISFDKDGLPEGVAVRELL